VVLFYLGVANYQLGKAAKNKAQMTEAAKFSEECASRPGPYQAQAKKNATSEFVPSLDRRRLRRNRCRVTWHTTHVEVRAMSR